MYAETIYGRSAVAGMGGGGVFCNRGGERVLRGRKKPKSNVALKIIEKSGAWNTRLIDHEFNRASFASPSYSKVKGTNKKFSSVKHKGGRTNIRVVTSHAMGSWAGGGGSRRIVNRGLTTLNDFAMRRKTGKGGAERANPYAHVSTNERPLQGDGDWVIHTVTRRPWSSCSRTSHEGRNLLLSTCEEPRRIDLHLTIR